MNTASLQNFVLGEGLMFVRRVKTVSILIILIVVPFTIFL